MKSTLKFLIVIGLSLVLSSCIVSAAAGLVKTTAKVGYSVVKGTVNTVGWTIKKAKGKINENRLDGRWKIIGVYQGTYDSFAQEDNPTNQFQNPCGNLAELMEFKTKKHKFKGLHCEGEPLKWVDYDLKFGKNPQTKERENYLKYNTKSYISVIEITGKTLVLEGNLNPSDPFMGRKLYLLEKTR